MAITKRGDKGSSLTYNEMDDNFEAIAPRTSATGSVQIPAGDTASRDGSPSLGYFRYNTQLSAFEGYQNGAWQGIGGVGSGDVNQNAFSIISVAGQTNVVADSATDTLSIIAGTNVTITTDATNDTITINSSGGGGSFDGAYTSLTGVPSTFPPSAHNQAWSTITNTPTTLGGYGITDGATGTQGTTGSVGPEGPEGMQGTGGTNGAQGTNGIGISGNQGVQGIQGEVTGVVGPQGTDGVQGTTGSGVQGSTGTTGFGVQGVQGGTGTQGTLGTDGDPGDFGPQGIQGAAGSVQGLQGTDGSQGADGPEGFGLQGIQGGGGPGPQGLQGDTGPAGFGLQGIQGTDGIQGLDGAGSQGIQGVQGLPSDIQGVQGLLGIQGGGTQGIQGPSGNVQGVQGNSGVGDTGAQGLQGESFQGTIGGSGGQGVQGVQGLQGTQGFQGLIGFGTQGTDGIQGTTGAAGETGLATQGVQGIQGESVQGLTGVGLQGPIGFQGVQSIQGLQGPDNGITYSAFTVTTGLPSAGGALDYSDINGEFTFTPAAPVTLYSNSSIISIGSTLGINLNGTTFTPVYAGTETTGELPLDASIGNTIAVTASANYSVVITNHPTTGSRVQKYTIFSYSNFRPTTVVVGGTTSTVKWNGGSAPSPVVSRINVFEITVFTSSSILSGVVQVLGEWQGSYA